MIPLLLHSRVRPDEVTGFAWLDVPRGRDSWDAEVVYVIAFDYWLADHAGTKKCGMDLEQNASDAQRQFHYSYCAVSYDDAWPWDLITDPDIRDTVYAEYTPL